MPSSRSEQAKRITLFALYPMLGILTPLLTIPVVTSRFGASGWSVVAVGQSIGAAASVFVELAWGLDGPQLVAAAQSKEDRRNLFHQSARGRLFAFCAVAIIITLPCAAVRPHQWASTWLFSLTTLSTGISSAWFMAGLSRPGLALVVDSLPRATMTLIACGALLAGAPLVTYGAALTVAGLSSPILAGVILRYGFPNPFRRYPAAVHRKMSFNAFGARTTSTFYLALPTTLVALVSSESVVATFSVADRLMRMGLTALAFLPTSMQGPLGRTSDEQIAPAITRVFRVNATVGLVAALIAAVMLPLTLPIVTHGVSSLRWYDAVFLGVTVASTCTSRGIGSVALVRLNAIRIIFRSALTGALVGVPLLMLGAVHYGVTGAFAGVAMSELIVVTYQATALRRIMTGLRPRGSRP